MLATRMTLFHFMRNVAGLRVRRWAGTDWESPSGLARSLGTHGTPRVRFVAQATFKTLRDVSVGSAGALGPPQRRSQIPIQERLCDVRYHRSHRESGPW